MVLAVLYTLEVRTCSDTAVTLHRMQEQSTYSPLWMRKCSFRWCLYLKAFPHSVHLNLRLPPDCVTCLCKKELVFYISHSRWVWWFRCLLQAWSHSSHKYRIFPRRRVVCVLWGSRDGLVCTLDWSWQVFYRDLSAEQGPHQSTRPISIGWYNSHVWCFQNVP